MKKKNPPISKPVAPISFKLMLILGGILIIVVLVLTVRSIIGVLRCSSSPPDAMQTDTETVVVHPVPPAGEHEEGIEAEQSPILSPLATSSFPSNQPAMLTDPNKILEQRRPARMKALEEVQRQREVPVPREVREQREQQRKALIEAAKKELIEQAGTSGVPKEALQKFENSNPILF